MTTAFWTAAFSGVAAAAGVIYLAQDQAVAEVVLNVLVGTLALLAVVDVFTNQPPPSRRD
jgi:hypothetical protein